MLSIVGLEFETLNENEIAVKFKGETYVFDKTTSMKVVIEAIKEDQHEKTSRFS